MRDILKRIFIGVAVGMALFFLKSQVFAAELASSSGYRVTYSSGVATGTSSCAFTGTISNSGLITAGTGFSNTTSGSCQYYRSVGINVQTPSDTSKQFVPGIQYTLKFLWNSNPRPSGLAFDDTITPQIYNGSSYVDSALVQITSWSAVTASDNYGTYITINFTVTSRQRYINFVMVPLNMSVSPNFYFFRYYQQGVNIKNFELTETDNATVVAIQDQTNKLLAGISNVILSITNSNQELLDSDSPADWTANNDYSTVDYDDVESDLHDLLEDSFDPTALDIDFTQWHLPFQWIFLKLTQFVQLNGKVFAMITAFLTLSFVGLVFNR